MKIEIKTNELEERIVERLLERLKYIVKDSGKTGDDKLFTVESLAAHLSMVAQ